LLRQKIKSLIEASANSEEASIKICRYLDDELDLSGNGWFDDDEAMSEGAE
jgi:hypothetical protein